MSPNRRRKPLSSRAAWALLGAVAIAVLAYGSSHPSQGSQKARVSSLDSLIKCPACQDLSIAQSDAPSSVTLRHEVARFVRAGWSNARIESWVTARYGSTALLVPQSSSDSTILYLVPVALVGLGVAGLGWYLWRRRPDPADRAGETLGT